MVCTGNEQPLVHLKQSRAKMAQVRYIRLEIMETRDFHDAHSVGNNCFIAPETSSAMTRQAGDN